MVYVVVVTAGRNSCLRKELYEKVEGRILNIGKVVVPTYVVERGEGA